MIHKRRTTLLPFKRAPLSCSNVPLTSRDIITWHWLCLSSSLQYENDSFKTHLFNTVWEVFAECFERVLRAYAWQQQS